jgi:O-antigen ligase
MLVLINCAAFGEYNSIGRLFLRGSIYLENSNDIAVVLVIDIGYCYYLALRPGALSRTLGAVGMLGCLYFIVKTGSRGGLLALLAFLVVLFVFSLNKLTLVAVGLPILGISLALTPQSLIHRFTLMLVDQDTAQAKSESDVAAIGSQLERQELIKKAVRYTLAHPLTGVGPGQFANTVWGDEHKAGKWSPTLGTHNTYLEISSECGLPAFFCYVAIVFGCIRVNYKSLKRLRQRPDQADAARLAYCMLAISTSFAVSIFFHHLSYTNYLPLISGLTVCVSLAVSAPRTGPAPSLVRS